VVALDPLEHLPGVARGHEVASPGKLEAIVGCGSGRVEVPVGAECAGQRDVQAGDARPSVVAGGRRLGQRRAAQCDSLADPTTPQLDLGKARSRP
jgi:hypothetical protein